MRGRTVTDVEVLDQSLIQADGGLDKVPLHAANILAAMSMEDLEQSLVEGCRIVSLMMAQKGWILMEIKQRAGHNNFKPRLAELGIEYKYANQCMNVARAISSHPALAQIPDSHLIRKIAYLPDDTKAEIAEAIRDDPKRAELLADAWRKNKVADLFPWTLATIGVDLRINGNKKPAKDPGRDIPLPTDVDKLVAQALSCLLKIAALDLSDDAYDNADWARWDTYCEDLDLAFDRAAYNLTDPKHEAVPIWEMHPMADDVTGSFDDERGDQADGQN